MYIYISQEVVINIVLSMLNRSLLCVGRGESTLLHVVDIHTIQVTAGSQEGGV